jgi:SAM-dependent methyltransferase
MTTLRALRKAAKPLVLPWLWASSARRAAGGEMPPRQGAAARETDLRVSERGHLHCFCVLCRSYCRHDVRGPNLREEVICRVCGSTTRQRQLALALEAALHGRRAPSRIWSTECTGVAHAILAARFAESHHEYVGTGYFGPSHQSGDMIRDVRHEDLQRPSFGNETVDFVLSSDVFEHIPDPYLAHREIHRVLRPGGAHLFAVPFDENAAADDTRARLGADGRVEHLSPPLYHSDPLSADGVLVFTIFAPEMLRKLEAIGFEVRAYRLWNPMLGLLGDNGLIFAARKPA